VFPYPPWLISTAQARKDEFSSTEEAVPGNKGALGEGEEGREERSLVWTEHQSPFQHLASAWPLP